MEILSHTSLSQYNSNIPYQRKTIDYQRKLINADLTTWEILMEVWAGISSTKGEQFKLGIWLGIFRRMEETGINVRKDLNHRRG